MPRHRLFEAPLTAAQRQARHRAKLRQESGPPPTAPAPRLPPRPSRWAAAVAVLIVLQDEYRTWFDNLPDNLEGSRLADKLQEITEPDLGELLAIDPPAATAATEGEKKRLRDKAPYGPAPAQAGVQALVCGRQALPPPQTEQTNPSGHRIATRYCERTPPHRQSAVGTRPKSEESQRPPRTVIFTICSAQICSRGYHIL